MTLPLGHVRIFTDDRTITVLAPLDETIPKVAGGFGRFTETEIPRRLTITEWAGQDAYRMSFGILLDGHSEGRSVQPQVDQLEAMCRVPGGKKRPPVVHAEGPLPRSASVDWWIESLDWSDDVFKSIRVGGILHRQGFTVNLLQVVEDEAIRLLRKAPGRGGRTHKLRKGETAQKLAHHFLGTAKRYREILKANGVRSNNGLEKLVGKMIRIPDR